MGRMRKQTAEYFPHFVGDSRTKFVLENQWGNDGYAFWFKLLELLCRSDGHFYDCSQPADMRYLEALTKVSEDVAKDILDELAEMGKIDKDLWTERRVIWCQSLVDNLAAMYAKRTTPIPVKPFSEPVQAEDDAEQKPERKSPKSPEKTNGIYEEVVSLYNEICKTLPRCRNMSEARKKAIKARMSSGYTMESFRELFEKAEASSFLHGSNDRNWRANFDWLIKDANIAKVLDGNYDNKDGGSNYGANRGYSQSDGFKPSDGFRG